MFNSTPFATQKPMRLKTYSPATTNADESKHERGSTAAACCRGEVASLSPLSSKAGLRPCLAFSVRVRSRCQFTLKVNMTRGSPGNYSLLPSTSRRSQGRAPCSKHLSPALAPPSASSRPLARRRWSRRPDANRRSHTHCNSSKRVGDSRSIRH